MKFPSFAGLVDAGICVSLATAGIGALFARDWSDVAVAATGAIGWLMLARREWREYRKTPA